MVGFRRLLPIGESADGIKDGRVFDGGRDLVRLAVDDLP